MTFSDGEAEPARQPRTAAPAGVAEISHDAIRDQLSESLDGALAERDQARIDEHLRYCRACRAYRATLAATAKAVSELPREKAPLAAKQRLLDIAES